MKYVQTYANVRDDIKDGDIAFFVSNKSIYSKVITFFTKSKFVHVGILFWMDVGDELPRRLMIIEADKGTKRRIVNMSDNIGREIHVVRPKLRFEEYASYAFEKLGEIDYSFKEVVHAGVRDFLNRYLSIKIKAKDYDGEICSEFVGRMLKLQKINVTPGQLKDVLKDKGLDTIFKFKM